MERSIFITDDGSHSLRLSGVDECYHSVHGAIQESSHVFIEQGLMHIQKKNIRIIEMGFGTGLNALLSLVYTQKSHQRVEYFAIEKFPLESDEYKQLNYPQQLDINKEIFNKFHDSISNSWFSITPTFTLYKSHQDFLKLSGLSNFDLMYFDAFGPEVQPELWEEASLVNAYNSLSTGGLFLTYCAKGKVRRLLQNIGFKVERLPGPPGKREMLRATKQ